MAVVLVDRFESAAFDDVLEPENIPAKIFMYREGNVVTFFNKMQRKY